MKLFLLLSILSTCTGALCQQNTLINKHFDALNKHDIKLITAGYDDSAKIYSPNWEGAKTSLAGITDVYSRYFTSTPDLSYKVLRIINAGSDVVVEFVSGGTLSNPEGNTPTYMKDKKYTLKYCAIFTFTGNKIIQETDYFDQVAFLRQVGFFDQK